MGDWELKLRIRLPRSSIWYRWYFYPIADRSCDAVISYSPFESHLNLCQL